MLCHYTVLAHTMTTMQHHPYFYFQVASPISNCFYPADCNSNPDAYIYDLQTMAIIELFLPVIHPLSVKTPMQLMNSIHITKHDLMSGRRVKSDCQVVQCRLSPSRNVDVMYFGMS